MRFKEDIRPEFAKSNTEELRKDRVQTDNPTEPRLSPEQIEEVRTGSAVHLHSQAEGWLACGALEVAYSSVRAVFNWH
jgi:hypothetical protein